MAWAHVGAVIREAIEDSALEEEDCKCFTLPQAVTFRRGVRKIHWDVLSQFEEQLSLLKGVIDSQIAQSAETKTKILAGMCTITIASLQFLGAKLFPAWDKSELAQFLNQTFI